MHTWQSLLLNGNDCFDSHNWIEAERYYLKAIELLDSLKESHRDESLLYAWICGYHNLSELYKQQGQITRSAQSLIVPHQYILQRLQNSESNEQTTLNAIKITLPPLLTLAKSFPLCDNCVAQLIKQTELLTPLPHTLH